MKFEDIDDDSDGIFANDPLDEVEEDSEQLHLFDHDTNIRLRLELPDFIQKSHPQAIKAMSKKQKSKEQLDLEEQLSNAYKKFNLNGAKKDSIYWKEIVDIMNKLDKFR